MGWGFRKSVKIAPGIRVNLSKKGVSTSFGGKGFTYNTRGRVSASIPGTGIHFSHNLNSKTRGRQDARLKGSTSIDNDGAERLSKREQATRDFVQLLQGRLSEALRQYFLSHGVYVQSDDLAEAASLDEHQYFINDIAADLERTTRAIRLAVDIGTISLAEKEKAMGALYDIELKCKVHAGDRHGLEETADALHRAISQWPENPKYFWPFIVCIAGAFTTAGSLVIGILVLLCGAIYALLRQRAFEQKRTAAQQSIENAKQEFSAVVITEVSPRPEFAIPANQTRARLIMLGVIVVAIAGYVLSTKDVANHVTKPSDSRAVEQAGQRALDSKAEKSRAVSSKSITNERVAVPPPDFRWLEGIPPSEAVKDSRIRSAFNAVPAGDWRKIVERLNVSNAAGIQIEDGYYLARGCKAHFCDSDSAAFAINRDTGKGVIAYRESGDSGSGKPKARSFSWPELSLGATPLKSWWGTQSTAETDVSRTATLENAASQKTGFDCAKARSFVEKLICQDPELAQYDRELAEIFAKVKQTASDPNALKEHARQAWNYRETACKDRECLVRWYVDEKIALREFQ